MKIQNHLWNMKEIKSCSHHPALQNGYGFSSLYISDMWRYLELLSKIPQHPDKIL